MPLLLSRCHLVAYIGTCFFVPSFSSLMNPLHSFFFTSLLSLTKLFLYLLLSFTHGNNHGFFFFFLACQKLLQSITLSPCSGCSFLLLFFFLFLSKKISQKLSLPKRKFCLKLSRTLMRVQRLIECYG